MRLSQREQRSTRFARQEARDAAIYLALKTYANAWAFLEAQKKFAGTPKTPESATAISLARKKVYVTLQARNVAIDLVLRLRLQAREKETT